jgi:hypothetical protein
VLAEPRAHAAATSCTDFREPAADDAAPGGARRRGRGCTSTSRCTGAQVDVPGKVAVCVVAVCTPMLPDCVYAKVWYTDEEDAPTVDDGGCLLIPLDLP